MKKIIALVLSILVVISCFAGCTTENNVTPTTAPKSTSAPTEEPTEEPTEAPTEEPTPTAPPAAISNVLVFPEDNTKFSADFAKQVICLNLSEVKEGFVTLANYFGFTNLLDQQNFGKDPTDASHTSAYTLTSGTVTYKGTTRNMVLVQIAATQTGEWASNIDFVPSHDNDALYAENFFLAAQDIMAKTKDIIKGIDNPLVLVTGYSRGAAVGNLLGSMVNEEFGSENCFTYTFATPTTIRSEEANKNSSNIFNVVNSSDMISILPPVSLNFYRAGTDYIVQGNEKITTALTEAIGVIGPVVTDIKTYYEKKFSLNGAGIDEETGSTIYDISKELVVILDNNQENKDLSGLYKYLFMSSESELYPIISTLFSLIGHEDFSIEELLTQHTPLAYVPLLGLNAEDVSNFLASLGLKSTYEVNIDDLFIS